MSNLRISELHIFKKYFTCLFLSTPIHNVLFNVRYPVPVVAISQGHPVYKSVRKKVPNERQRPLLLYECILYILISVWSVSKQL